MAKRIISLSLKSVNMAKYNYSEKVDKALGEYMATHRSLRTCFDPGSHEWSETSMEKKVEILKKIVADGNDLQRIILYYKSYFTEMNKPHVVKGVEDGLIELLKYLLDNKQPEQI
jgi:hypothetical protein